MNVVRRVRLAGEGEDVVVGAAVDIADREAG